MSRLVANKYIIDECIGSGKFGDVFKGKHFITGQHVAIKIETSNYKILKHETTILNYLFRKGCRGIPTIFWYGIYNERPALIISYYDNVLTASNFSPLIFINMIEIISHIHNSGVIHRDIKPANFMLKGGNIYLIDFGFATFYVDENFKHKENSVREYITGTPAFISINIHNGNEPSRRDDLISLGYIFLHCKKMGMMLMEFVPNAEHLNKVSPHSLLSIRHHSNLERRECKKRENLFLGLDNSRILENESEQHTDIFKYLEYCYSLKYDETPDYNLLKEFFTHE